MFSTFLVAALAVCASPADSAAESKNDAASRFATYFTGATLRVDYYHSGVATEEHVSLDRVRLEGDWPGSRVHLLDHTNLGKYLFVVTDLASQRTLYTRGFCSIYGEWETIGEARQGTWRTFHESLRFPEPKRPFQVTLRKRGGDGAFREIWSVVVDPNSRFVDRSPIRPAGSVHEIAVHGPAATKVDLLVLGDGYAADEAAKLFGDAKRLTGKLFATEPFRSRRRDFNVRVIAVPSPRSGISNPRKSEWVDSPLGLSFNAFDSDRYVLTYRNRALRDVAAQVDYDHLMLLANTAKYGGGGIFNLWATCAADTSQADYIFVHELGHSFAGLADEYYTSQVAYEEFTPPGTEPWEPNVTAFLDPQRLKWRELVTAATPLPTPWNQAVYDKASYDYQKKRRRLIETGAPVAAMDALFRDIRERTAPMLAAEKHAGQVGAFEGAGYQAKGLYRPSVDCIMFSRNPSGFCPVCARAIERVIEMYAE